MSRLNLSTQLVTITQDREHQALLPVATVPEIDAHSVIGKPLMVELRQDGTNNTLEHLADTQKNCAEQAFLVLCQLIERPYADEHDPIGKYALYSKRQQCSGQKLSIFLKLRTPSQGFPLDFVKNYIHQLENFACQLVELRQHYSDIHPVLIDIIDHEYNQLIGHKQDIIQLVQSCPVHQEKGLTGSTRYCPPQPHPEPEEVYVPPTPQEPDNPAYSSNDIHKNAAIASSGEPVSCMPVVPAGISPVNTHQRGDYPSFFLAKSPATALSVAAAKRPGQVLSIAELVIQQQYTNRCVASLLADTDEPQMLAAKPVCLTAGATIHPTIFTAGSSNCAASGKPLQLAMPVPATPTLSFPESVKFSYRHTGQLPIRQRKTPVYFGCHPTLISTCGLSERNHTITPALTPSKLTARYHVPP